MRNIIFVILLFVIPNSLSAQSVNNTWYLNGTKLINFNNTPPTIDFFNSYNLNSGYNTSVSDEDGDLIFVSTGNNILNRNGDIMPNGNDLDNAFVSFWSEEPSFQPVVAVQIPNQDRQYYLFVLSDGYFNIWPNNDFLPGTLQYSIVDMNLDDGNGGIVQGEKNISLADNLTGAMTTTQGICGSVWVITHEYSSNRFVAIEISEAGIGEPVLSSSGLNIFYNSSNSIAGKSPNGVFSSPDGSKLVYFFQNEVQLFDFDKTTGIVSNPIDLPLHPASVSGTFSSNGDFFYTTEPTGPPGPGYESTILFRFDVSSNQEDIIQNSKIALDTIDSGSTYSFLQRGPDNNIYGLNGRNAYRVDNSDNPDVNEVSVADEFLINNSAMGQFTYNLPNIMAIPSSPITIDSLMLPTDTIFCQVAEVDIILDPTAEGNSYIWQDGSQNETFSASTSGVYRVEVQKGNCTYVDSIHIELSDLYVELPTDTVLCTQENLTLMPNTNGTDISWQDGSSEATFNVSEAGEYILSTQDENCEVSDTILINYSDLFVALPNDTTLCQTEDFIINPLTNGSQLTWQDGSNEATFNVSQTGEYTLLAQDENCEASDTILVSYSDVFVELPNDTTLCQTEEFIINPLTNGSQLTWQDGSNEATFNVNQAGEYTLSVQSDNCEASDTIQVNYSDLYAELPEDTTLCQTEEFVINPMTNSSELIWQDGSNASTFIASQAGEYILSVQGDNCEVSDTMLISYFDLFVELPEDTTLCIAGEFSINPLTNGSQLTWQDGSNEATFNVSEAGEYTLLAQNDNCEASDTILINYSDLFVALPNDTTLCQTEEFIINPLTNGSELTWQDGSNEATFNVSEAGEYTLFAQDENCEASDTILINYSNLFVALPNDTTLCQTEEFIINPLTNGSQLTWQDGSNEATFNVSQPGEYILDVQSENCEVSDTILVNYSDLFLDLADSTKICENENLLLSPSTNATLYDWQNGINTLDFEINEAGTYILMVGDEYDCNITDTIIALSVQFSPEIIPEGSFCANDSVYLSTSLSALQYIWSDNSNTEGIFVHNSGIYSVSLTNEDGCYAEAEINLEENLEIDIDFSLQNPLCFEDSTGFIQIDSTQGGLSPFIYALNDLNFSNEALFENLSAGDYTLTVEDAEGCQATTSVNLSSSPELIVDVGDDIIAKSGSYVVLNPETNFTPVSQIWSPNSFFTCDTCLQTRLTAITSGNYQLIAVDENGCTASDDFKLTVSDIYIPNAFSPDNNGINDYFTIYAGENAVQIDKLQVFDRWGSLVFEKENIPLNTPELGWKGDARGENAASGVYIYLAQVKMQNGETEILKGELSLVR